MIWKVIIGSTLLLVTGCSSDTQIPESVLVKARMSFEDGILSVRQKEYEAAIPLLTDALNNGALINTEIIDTFLARAKAYIFTQQLNLALDDINSALRGVEDTSQIAKLYAMRSLYYKKSSDLPKSDAEFQLAQSIDPNVQPVTQ